MSSLIRLTLVALCFLPAGLAGTTPGAPLTWATEVSPALARAHDNRRLVLVLFTLSNARFTRELREEILTTPFFSAYARDHLELVEVNVAPTRAATTTELLSTARLTRQYGISFYPIMVVLSPDGVDVAHLGYMQGGPKTFVRELRSIESRLSKPKAP